MRRSLGVDTTNLLSVPIIEKITFGGEVVVTKPSDRPGYKGRLFWAEEGDFIYSKIRLKQGSLAVVPTRVAVSNEYPVYCVANDRVEGQYLSLVLRTKAFQRILAGMSHGGSTKTRITPIEFERLAVPVPALPIQHAILAEWGKAHAAIAVAEGNVREIEAETGSQFLTDLGLHIPNAGATPKFFAVPWTDLLRWSVSYNQTALTSTDLTRGRFPVAGLGSVLDLVQYGTSEKANTRSDGVPVLRINNIKDGVLDITNLKHIPLPDRTLTGLCLKDGDILIIRTSGSRDLVGTCAVFHEKGSYVYASYLIRMRLLADRADPDFVACFINSALGRQQVNAISRQIMQNNINSQELRSLQIPLPPLAVQRRIMEKVAAGRARIARERETARALAAQIETDMEAYLLGTKKVE